MNNSYKKITLPNGLSVVLKPMSSVRSVTVCVTVGAGPRYETEKTAGLAHFLEHMLFEGTKRFPSSKNIAEYIEGVGGKSGAWTDKEYIAYYTKVPSDHLDIAFDYLTEILFHSILDSKTIEKEKGIIMEELRRKIDNPEVEIWDSWMKWVWGKNQSLGRSTLGDEATIQMVSQQELQKYMSSLYHPANMVIAVVGDFLSSQAEKYIIKYFGGMRKKVTPTFHKVKFTPKQTRTEITHIETQQSQLILGFVTNVSYYHRDRFPLQVVAAILATGTSSRIFNKLVYELGIAYTVGVVSWPFSDTGLFSTYGGFAEENIEKAISIICEELEDLKKEKITDKELHETKEKIKSDIFFSQETPDAIAYLYATQLITKKRIQTIEEMVDKINNVTAEDIQHVAQKYFTHKNLCVTIRGPIDEDYTQSIEDVISKKLS